MQNPTQNHRNLRLTLGGSTTPIPAEPLLLREGGVAEAELCLNVIKRMSNMEIKRTPYRILHWHKSDCADIQDAISRAMKLLDKELSDATMKGDVKSINQMVKERATLHTLLVAAVEL